MSKITRFLRHRSYIKSTRRRYHALKAFYQRGRRGWADQDVWSLDIYLSRVMGESIAHLAATDHGWPDTTEWPTYDGWQKELREVSRILLNYEKRLWSGVSEKENREAEQELAEALARISKYFGHLWD